MDRRRFLKTAAGLFVPAAPAILLPKLARAQGGMGPGPGTVHSTGGAATTLNPSDKNANIVLTNGNLTATTGGGGGGNVRGTTSYSSGKLYCEVTVGSVDGASFSRGIGFANASASLTNLLGTPDTNSGALYNGNALFFRGGGNAASGVTYGLSSVVSMALDLNNSTIWYRNNGGNWNGNAANDPATNTGGLSITAVGAGPYFFALYEKTGGVENTVNFGATAYTYTPPSGFGNW